MNDQLSFAGKQWIISGDRIDHTTIARELATQRGLDADNAIRFSAKLYPDAEKAAARIEHACANKETIAIFGDYDCDGVTSTAQLLRALRRRDTEPIVRLPHRVHDGYGLKKHHIDELQEQGASVIICVDTGISAVKEIAYAKEQGIDMIILDHHHVRDIPKAYATIHPALHPDFPAAHPAAAGVVHTFLHALEGSDWEEKVVDDVLATIGTVADLVPLHGGNRTLVQEGLAAIDQLPQRSPLKELITACCPRGDVRSTDIAFRIAPRINAAGRMADPTIALRALLEGGEALHDMETLNVLRQEETHKAYAAALQELNADAANLPAFLSIASSSYRPGIVGLLSGKLTEQFGRPSMAVHIGPRLCTASFRSTPAYNMVEAIERHKHLCVHYGGHAQAAGATFALEHLPDLCAALERDAEQYIAPSDRVPTMHIDATLDIDVLTTDLITSLHTLEPFGQGNPEPLFMVPNMQLENARRVGQDGKHLQAMIGPIKVIAFNGGHLADQIQNPVDLACRVQLDTWNDRESVQLVVADMRAAKGTYTEAALINNVTKAATFAT